MNLLKTDFWGNAIIPAQHEGDNVLDFVEDEENFQAEHYICGGIEFVVHFYVWNKADQNQNKYWLSIWAEAVFNRFKLVIEKGDPNYDDPGDVYIESMDDCIDICAADFHSEEVFEETIFNGKPRKIYLEIRKSDACQILRCSETDFDSVLAKACAITKEKTQKFSEKYYLEDHPEVLQEDLANQDDDEPD